MENKFYALDVDEVAQASRLGNEHVSASKSAASVGFTGGMPALL